MRNGAEVGGLAGGNGGLVVLDFDAGDLRRAGRGGVTAKYVTAATAACGQ